MSEHAVVATLLAAFEGIPDADVVAHFHAALSAASRYRDARLTQAEHATAWRTVHDTIMVIRATCSFPRSEALISALQYYVSGRDAEAARVLANLQVQR